MADIVLCTLNAKWIHSSLGLRYLFANLGELRGQAQILESTIHERPLDLVERILATAPRIVGFGVYVWNAHETELVVALLRAIAPQVLLVLGGPEVSHEVAEQRLTGLVDYVICGEADLAFAELCRQILAGTPPSQRIVTPSLPDLTQLASPYTHYASTDIAQRVVYVEASRGCPFACEFCLSALDEKVREFPLAALLREFEALLERGLRHFKFVDRTFNLSLKTSCAILDFFLARQNAGLFLHFEMIPDRLPPALRERLLRFPAGMVQLEVGIQTWDVATARRIARVQQSERIEENLRFLRAETGVHVHADLIAGLPGEGLESFARGFDRLLALRPHEIQVGILKRLRGAPIARHTEAHALRFAAHPPYEVLATDALSFEELQGLRRLARTWDLVGNRGNFVGTLPLLWREGSAFAAIWDLSEDLQRRGVSLQAITLERLAEELLRYLVGRGLAPEVVGRALLDDFLRTRPGHWPTFLQPYAPAGLSRRKQALESGGFAARQMRALATGEVLGLSSARSATGASESTPSA